MNLHAQLSLLRSGGGGLQRDSLRYCIFLFSGPAYTEGSTDYILFLKIPRCQKKNERKKEKKKKISGDSPESPYFTYVLISLISLKDELIDNGEEKTFDMAYIDADKWNYYIYYDKCMQLVRKGGVILIDDVRIPSQ